MKYRRLGRTNLRVSVVGLGTWQFGGEWAKDFSQGEADRIIDRAADLGINLIDTAECYGDHTSEAFIGNALARRGDRDKWVIATKFGHHFLGQGPGVAAASSDPEEMNVSSSICAIPSAGRMRRS